MRYGWRGKIGLIYPAPGTAGEVEFHRIAPEGVAVLTTRIPLEKVDAQALIRMADHTEQAASLLAQAKPDVIAYCCTAGSLVKGMGYDKEIIERIESRTGISAITTTTAVVDGLNVLKVRRVAVVTPYPDEINEREKAFMEGSGFEITYIKGLGVSDPQKMQDVRPEQMYRLAKEAYTERPDALFISCTGISVIEVIEPLEKDLAIPVITSNQATMWASLRKINIRDLIDGLGKLFKV